MVPMWQFSRSMYEKGIVLSSKPGAHQCTCLVLVIEECLHGLNKQVGIKSLAKSRRMAPEKHTLIVCFAIYFTFRSWQPRKVVMGNHWEQLRGITWSPKQLLGVPTLGRAYLQIYDSSQGAIDTITKPMIRAKRRQGWEPIESGMTLKWKSNIL